MAGRKWVLQNKKANGIDLGSFEVDSACSGGMTLREDLAGAADDEEDDADGEKRTVLGSFTLTEESFNIIHPRLPCRFHPGVPQVIPTLPTLVTTPALLLHSKSLRANQPTEPILNEVHDRLKR